MLEPWFLIYRFGISFGLKHSFYKRIFFRFQVKVIPVMVKIRFIPIWVFPKMVVPPKHPKVIIFSRKTNGFVGETHHFRKPPFVVWRTFILFPPKTEKNLSLSVRRNIHFSRSSSSRMDSWKVLFFFKFFCSPQTWWCEQGSLNYPFLGGNHYKCMKCGLVIKWPLVKEKDFLEFLSKTLGCEDVFPSCCNFFLNFLYTLRKMTTSLRKNSVDFWSFKI